MMSGLSAHKPPKGPLVEKRTSADGRAGTHERTIVCMVIVGKLYARHVRKGGTPLSEIGGHELLINYARYVSSLQPSSCATIHACSFE